MSIEERLLLIKKALLYKEVIIEHVTPQNVRNKKYSRVVLVVIH